MVPVVLIVTMMGSIFMRMVMIMIHVAILVLAQLIKITAGTTVAQTRVGPGRGRRDVGQGMRSS